jgi:predicted nuclease of predicted toxin-antitoxin system
MRFLADENIPSVVVARLRASGYDVVAIAETAAGSSDDQVLSIAVADQRILLTEDRDFGQLVVRRRIDVGGVVLVELAPLSNEVAAVRVEDVVVAQIDKLPGNLVVVEPGRVRIRPLDHRSD